MGIPNIQCGIATGVNLEGLIDALADEGWHPKRQRDGYIGFTRNNKNYLAACPENQETLLVLCAPRIYQLTQYGDWEVMLETFNEINSSAGLGKIYLLDDAVWVRLEVRHQRMGTAAALLTTYIDDIDEVVKAFYENILTASDDQPDSLQ